ncbi:MAG: hypothetical protein FJ145_23625 [Deltaproteobacteria bacterium]|nr:hypothetical protein [Deltaproteobacteria bacterium]
MISAVVLAADRVELSGSQRLLQPARGKPLLQWVLENAVNSHLDEVICVVRDLAQIRPHIALHHDKLFWLVDYGADRSKSHSLIAGLWAVHPASDGVMFMGGERIIDLPLIDTLIERFHKTNGWIVAADFAGSHERRGPRLFHRELFPDLIKLKGDQQESILLDKYRDNTESVEWNDALSSADPKQQAPTAASKELN